MAPEQRERKNAADRARRLRLKGAEASPLVKLAKAVAEKPKATKAPKPKTTPPAVRTKVTHAQRAVAVEESDAKVVVSFRGTKEQKEKFDRLGGGKWARARIDAATLKPGQ